MLYAACLEMALVFGLYDTCMELTIIQVLHYEDSHVIVILSNFVAITIF